MAKNTNCKYFLLAIMEKQFKFSSCKNLFEDYFIVCVLESYIKPKDCKVEKDLFLCSNNKTCIKQSEVCDGINHCYDKSDEGSLCTKKNDCVHYNCPHKCVLTSSGPKCVCSPGYNITDTNNCTDINECDTYGTYLQT